MHFRLSLVLSASLPALLLGAQIAEAAEQAPRPAHDRKHATARQTGNAPRPANTPQKTRTVEGGSPESIIVLGAGQARETQTISRTAIQEYTPGTSPFKALSKLPGVMFTSSDPLGSYEWSQQIIIRGFDQSRLGFTFDGVPLGNLAYGNDNGLSIGRALQTENNGPATLTQGAGAVGVAASNDLGGALQFTSIDPSDKFGADVSGTIGSASTWRTIIRDRYTGQRHDLTLSGAKPVQLSLSVSAQHHWYDIEIGYLTATGTILGLAGHVETGRASESDPHLSSRKQPVSMTHDDTAL